MDNAETIDGILKNEFPQLSSEDFYKIISLLLPKNHFRSAFEHLIIRKEYKELRQKLSAKDAVFVLQRKHKHLSNLTVHKYCCLSLAARYKAHG